MRQDSKGRLYFITYGGLSVFDGARFTNYDLQSGLANNLVNDVIEISPDSILVATNSPMLNTLVRGKIDVFPVVDSFYPVTNTFLKSKDGHLYTAADDGLFVYNHNRFIRLPLFDAQGKDIGSNLDEIKEWDHFIFLKSWNGNQPEKLILYDRISQTVTDINYSHPILTLSINASNEVWVSFNEGIQMLEPVALSQGLIRFKDVYSPYFLSHQKNSYILFSENLDLWIYGSDQIALISPDGTTKTIRANQGYNFGGPYNLFIDREGILWIVTDGNGVIKLTGMDVIEMNEIIPGGELSATCIRQQGDTTWLFNKLDNSFYRINGDQTTTFRLKGKGHQVGNIFISGKSLHYIEQDNLYFVPDKDLATSYLNPLPLFPKGNKGFALGNAIKDKNGALILNVIEDDLNFYMLVFLQNKMVMRYPLSYSVDQFAMDSQGQIWAPTRDNHLLVLSTHPETPNEYLRLEHDYAKNIKGFEPRSFIMDTADNIWIGTRHNGVYYLKQNGDELQLISQFSTKEGMTDNFIYWMYCDLENNIWAGTQTGLDKIFLKDGQYVIDNVTKSKNIFKRIYKMVNANDNELWAMCYDGTILRVTDSQSSFPPVSPTLLLTSLSVNNVAIETMNTSFPYDQNNFIIQVAAPSFQDEKSILYSYRLTGSGNTNWSEPSNNADFNFINLAPGNYQLTIRADFPAALYPSQNLNYSFGIMPPYWRTLWFRILIGLSIIFLFSLIARYFSLRRLERQRIILESKQAMEKERTRIATDMHDDLGAGLTRIKFLSETIGIKKQLHQPVEEEIQNIRAHAHDMIDKMGEIVWALNEKNDSLSDLLAYTREYAVEYLSENGLKNVVTIPDDFPTLSVSGEFRRNVYLSVKEALHNIIKHARANEVLIDFIITTSLVIRIQDDGIGFDTTNIRPYSNGLVNMKKRMSDIGGNIAIEHNKGTIIILSAPLTS